MDLVLTVKNVDVRGAAEFEGAATGFLVTVTFDVQAVGFSEHEITTPVESVQNINEGITRAQTKLAEYAAALKDAAEGTVHIDTDF